MFSPSEATGHEPDTTGHEPDTQQRRDSSSKVTRIALAPFLIRPSAVESMNVSRWRMKVNTLLRTNFTPPREPRCFVFFVGIGPPVNIVHIRSTHMGRCPKIYPPLFLCSSVA